MIRPYMGELLFPFYRSRIRSNRKFWKTPMRECASLGSVDLMRHRNLFPMPLEWQTRGTQNPLLASGCGFKFSHKHLMNHDKLAKRSRSSASLSEFAVSMARSCWMAVSVDVPELTRGVNNRDDLDDLVPKSINDAIISHQNLTKFWEAPFLHGRPRPREAAESTDGLPEAVDRAPSVNARVPGDECVNRP
jgi:hypothetical protein